MLNLKLSCSHSNLQIPTDSFSRFISEPLEVGQGTTIGNILRRVLLTDLGGLSIVGIRINGVNDQFSILSGVREDVLEIILNLKEVVFKGPQQKETILRLKVQGPCLITASKFEAVPNLEIVNPHQYIATLTDTSFLELEVKLAWGQSYTLAKNVNLQNSSDYLKVDAVFMPVKKVAFQIQKRFSEALGSQEQLVLDVWTNGSLTPSQAIVEASKIIVNWFIPLESGDFLPLEARKIKISQEEKEEKKELASSKNKIHSLPIEELHLSVRAFNGLKRAQIHLVGDLLQFSVSELKKIKNFGQTSLNEVVSVLAKYSLVLKD